MQFLKWYSAIVTSFTAIYGFTSFIESGVTSDFWAFLIWGVVAYFCWVVVSDKNIK